MNKELSKVLRDRIKDVVFADSIFGLVQAVEFYQNDENDKRVVKRMPVAIQDIEQDCVSRETTATPDSSKKGIIYFEDLGTISNGRARNGFAFTSTLMLVCWINRARVVADAYAEITAMAIVDILERLKAEQNPENVSFFTALKVKVGRIPKQDALLFAKYTYDEKETQYLRPPFEFFGIELKCDYEINRSCISEIEIKEPVCY